MRGRLRAFLAAAVGSVLISRTGWAALASVIPSADVFVSASQPNNNYGGSGSLEVSGTGNANGEFQTLMRFDLSSVKASFDAAYGVGQWNITAATLQLTTRNPSSDPNNTL